MAREGPVRGMGQAHGYLTSWCPTRSYQPGNLDKRGQASSPQRIGDGPSTMGGSSSTAHTAHDYALSDAPPHPPHTHIGPPPVSALNLTCSSAAKAVPVSSLNPLAGIPAAARVGMVKNSVPFERGVNPSFVRTVPVRVGERASPATVGAAPLSRPPGGGKACVKMAESH